MKKPSILISLFVLVFAAQSCEKEIEFNAEVTEPMLVLNSLVEGETSWVKVKFSKSLFFLESGRPQFVEGGRIQLWVNDAFRGELKDDGEGIYSLDTRVLAGDRIRYRAEAPPSLNLPSVVAETHVPLRAAVLAVDSTATILQEDSIINIASSSLNGYLGKAQHCKFRFVVKVSDPPGERNYYRLQVKRKLFSEALLQAFKDVEKTNFVFDDPVVLASNNGAAIPFGTEGNGREEMYIFSDELFDGKVYPLSFSISAYRYFLLPNEQVIYPQKPHDEIYIDLQSISLDFYRYLRSLGMLNGQGQGDPFSEPVQIHTNVSGGLGVVASYTSSQHLILIQ